MPARYCAQFIEHEAGMAILTSNTHPTCYEISVAGQISPERAAWFGDLRLSVRAAPGGQHITTLSGALADQAALFGVLNRIRDLGLRLISVSIENRPRMDADERERGVLGGYAAQNTPH